MTTPTVLDELGLLVVIDNETDILSSVPVTIPRSSEVAHLLELSVSRGTPNHPEPDDRKGRRSYLHSETTTVPCRQVLMPKAKRRVIAMVMVRDTAPTVEVSTPPHPYPLANIGLGSPGPSAPHRGRLTPVPRRLRAVWRAVEGAGRHRRLECRWLVCTGTGPAETHAPTAG